MNNAKIEKAYLLMKEHKDSEVASLGLSNDELDIVGKLLQEDEMQQAPDQDGMIMSGIKSLASHSASFAQGALDFASGGSADEIYGGLTAAIRSLADPNDERPFAEKYAEAKRAWEEASAFYEQNYPITNIGGKVGGGLANLAATAPLTAGKTALQAAPMMAAEGGFYSAANAPAGEEMEQGIAGAALAPVLGPSMEAAGWGVKKLGGAVDKALMGAPSAVFDTMKDTILGGTEITRPYFRKLGAKIRNFKEVPNAIAERKAMAHERMQDLAQAVEKQVSESSDMMRATLSSADEWYRKQGKAPVSGEEVAQVVSKYAKAMSKERNWISLDDREKEKYLRVLNDLRERVLFKNEKDMMRYADNMGKSETSSYGTKSILKRDAQIGKAEEAATLAYAKEYGNQELIAQKQIPRNLDDEITEALQELYATRSEIEMEKAALNIGDVLGEKLNKIDTEFGENFAKEIGMSDVYAERANKYKQNLSLNDLNDIKNDLQSLTISKGTDTFTKSMLHISNPNIAQSPKVSRHLMGLERDIRNLLDVKADKATRALGLGNTYKQARETVSRDLAIQKLLPTVDTFKTMANDGSLSTGTAELSDLILSPSISPAHDVLKQKWEGLKPLLQEHDYLTQLNPARNQSKAGALQFRAGNVMQNVKESPYISPIANNYVVPRAVQAWGPDLDPVLSFLGENIGIPAALANEELTHARETVDDASLEQYVGELAPKLEGFFAPTPVMTSKGRARSAVVDRSGARARIVDPLERNAIREDVWNDHTMSIMDKSKKVNQLNRTEKIDLEPAEQVLGPTQVQYNPPATDVFGALNEQK